MVEGEIRSVQVRDQLTELIRARGLRPGDRLPSEAEISRLFDAGRSTTREALKLLEHEGLVVVHRGLGWYLTASSSLSVERPITRFESVTTMLAELGITATTAVVSVTEGSPTAGEREALGLDASETVVRVERLRSAAERPLVYSVDAVPRRLLPGPLLHRDWSGSLTDVLAVHGHRPTSSVARLQAVDVPDSDARRLSLDGMGPWLLITETAVTSSGERVLHAQDYHRGEDFTFNVLRR